MSGTLKVINHNPTYYYQPFTIMIIYIVDLGSFLRCQTYRLALQYYYSTKGAGVSEPSIKHVVQFRF